VQKTLLFSEGFFVSHLNFDFINYFDFADFYIGKKKIFFREITIKGQSFWVGSIKVNDYRIGLKKFIADPLSHLNIEKSVLMCSSIFKAG
jgi:hypothetical protein